MTNATRINEMSYDRVSEDGLAFYEPIEPVGDMKELEIGVVYYPSNYGGGGIYVNVGPVERNEHSVGHTFAPDIRIRGFRVFIKSATRKNTRALQNLASKIDPITKDIADLYNKEEYGEIEKLLKGIAV